MGLLSRNYFKPGPGVSKNERKKKGVFLYLDIVFRKFMKLMQANFLYTVISIPFLYLSFQFLAPLVMAAIGINTSIKLEGYTEEQLMQMSAMLEVFFRMTISLLIFNFIGFAPISAAYAFVTRCFTRGEHAWLISDGKDMIKSNFKQSILLFVMDVVILFFATNAIYFYRNLEMQNAGGMGNVFFFLRYIMYSVLAIFVFMHYYIYQIMVTYECKFKDLLKYSLIFALAKLPMTVILTVICGGILVGGAVLINSNPFMYALVFSIIGLTLTRYPIEFYVARVIEKNIKAEKKKEDKKKARISYIDE